MTVTDEGTETQVEARPVEGETSARVETSDGVLYRGTFGAHESGSVTGPGAIIQAPPLTPPPLSLVTIAPVTDQADLVDAEGRPVGERWVNGIQFLPEPTQLADAWGPCNLTGDFTDALNCPGVGFGTTFEAVYRDERSAFAYSASDAEGRVERGLLAHEIFQVEQQWWSGAVNPTGAHLTLASPAPVEPNGTTATGLRDALSFLEQAIADYDAGVGMIHLTPFLLNAFALRGGVAFRYENGRIYTPNGNQVVPGYGYDGTGPGGGSRASTASTQWAYVTDRVFLIRGEVQIIPGALNEMSPALPQQNTIPWRAVRPWGIYTNGALRAAVKVDTTVQ